MAFHSHTPEEVFERIFGSLTFVRGDGDTSAQGYWGFYSSDQITLWGNAFKRKLRSFSESSVEESMAFLVFHELGHDLNNHKLGIRTSKSHKVLPAWEYFEKKSKDIFGDSKASAAGYTYKAKSADNWKEYHADAVANWLNGSFDNTPDGMKREVQMNDFMRNLIFARFGHPEHPTKVGRVPKP